MIDNLADKGQRGWVALRAAGYTVSKITGLGFKVYKLNNEPVTKDDEDFVVSFIENFDDTVMPAWEAEILINELEAQQKPRWYRQAALGDIFAQNKLQEIEDKIAPLRKIINPEG